MCIAAWKKSNLSKIRFKLSIKSQLFYWLRDKGTQKGEVDFIIQNKGVVVPVEVKSKSAGHLKSMFYFLNEKKLNYAVKVSLDEYSIKSVKHKIDNEQVLATLINVPHYAIEKLNKILKHELLKGPRD